MRRRGARKAKSSGEGGGESQPKGPEMPAVVIEWGELLARAKASLDEHGVEVQAKREAAGERARARMAEAGLEPQWDLEGVKRALSAYYSDCVLGECALGFRRVFAAVGVKCSDFLDSNKVFPELQLVYEYIQSRRDELSRLEAKELASRAQASQKRLVTEEGCDLNQRAVELSLKATMRDVYGEGEREGVSGADAKRGISYNFPNMTVNWIVAPTELAKRVEAKPQPEAIDVG